MPGLELLSLHLNLRCLGLHLCLLRLCLHLRLAADADANAALSNLPGLIALLLLQLLTSDLLLPRALLSPKAVLLLPHAEGLHVLLGHHGQLTACTQVLDQLFRRW